MLFLEVRESNTVKYRICSHFYLSRDEVKGFNDGHARSFFFCSNKNTHTRGKKEHCHNNFASKFPFLRAIWFYFHWNFHPILFIIPFIFIFICIIFFSAISYQRSDSSNRLLANIHEHGPNVNKWKQQFLKNGDENEGERKGMKDK